MYLMKCLSHIESMTYGNQLNNPVKIKEILMKLPYKMHDDFRRLTSQCNHQRKPIALRDLVNFVRQEVRIRKQPIFGDIEQTKPVKSDTIITNETKKLMITTSEEATPESIGKECPCCKKTNHNLPKCYFFNNGKSYEEKVEFVKKHALRFGCLVSTSHQSKDCDNRLQCDNCNKSILLHSAGLIQRN